MCDGKLSYSIVLTQINIYANMQLATYILDFTYNYYVYILNKPNYLVTRLYIFFYIYIYSPVRM